MLKTWLKRFQSERSSSLAMMVCILLIGFGLRVAYLTVDRFHADEALYAGWALRILDRDLLLLSVPVDKPPFYLYALAGSMRLFGSSEVATRLPSLAASTLGIALIYRLGKWLYDRNSGVWAALFVTLSPYDILFARTAFTDPMLVLWTLGALCAVAADMFAWRRWFWTGICLGLAFATKQHAVLLIPFVVAVGLISEHVRREKEAGFWQASFLTKTRFLTGVLGFAIPFGLVVTWDSTRWEIRPGYWEQSAMSYGGLTWAAFAEWGERFVEWLSWARYLTGSPALNLLLLMGGSALLVQGWRHQPKVQRTWLDTLFAAYAIAYLVLHAALAFSIWDRYLLPLVIPLGLLWGRIVTQGRRWLASVQREHRWRNLALTAVVCLVTLLPGWKAAHNGYPIGGEHWAYQGLDEVATYLKQNAPPDAVLYHHWLRWHYTYYLHDTDFELRWWQSGEHLQREATRTPGRAQYIVLPDWHTLELDAEGVHLRPIYEARQQDGRISMRVYQIELEPEKTATTQKPIQGPTCE